MQMRHHPWAVAHSHRGFKAPVGIGSRGGLSFGHCVPLASPTSGDGGCLGSASGAVCEQANKPTIFRPIMGLCGLRSHQCHGSSDAGGYSPQSSSRVGLVVDWAVGEGKVVFYPPSGRVRSITRFVCVVLAPSVSTGRLRWTREKPPT